MVCIVLAAGYATRMYPLTESFPKPLLTVQGKPILNWLLEDICRIPEIQQILIVTNHKFYDQFAAWHMQLPFAKPIQIIDDGSTENENRRGAVMDILLALDTLPAPQDALIAAGDNVLEFSMQPFVHFARQTGHSAVMCYREPLLERQRRTGIITVNSASRITSFEEKPQSPKSDLAVPPFYVYTASDIQRIGEAVKDGCGTDAPGSLAAWLSRHSSVYAWPMPGKRHDIGNLEVYERVQQEYTPTEQQ